MLSILIPTYNYSAYPLVEELYNQCVEAKIVFEIIVLDDGSTDFQHENNKINSFKNCSYEILKKNIGRSAIRNLLARKAKFENLLFLDVDTIPIDENFILKYLNEIKKSYTIIYGGIKYQVEKPDNDKILRWIYGNKREALSVKKRKEFNYKSFLTLNFLINKEVFKIVSFNELIPNLRHEDTLFSYELMKNKISIQHIDNPVFHLGLDTNYKFLKKSEEAIIVLKHLNSNKILPYNYTKLGAIYIIVEKYYIRKIVMFSLSIFKFILVKNILGKNPSLFVFDLYRLYYYCKTK